jgi:dGTPase
MNWEALLSLRRHGDTTKRIRKEQDEIRLGFEVDYDRIVFSSYFRSLQDKTQVIPFSKTDFVHTRLTHSLEVSVVARSLGRLAGKELLKRHPHLQEVHGYQPNDFGAIVAAASNQKILTFWSLIQLTFISVNWPQPLRLVMLMM